MIGKEEEGGKRRRGNLQHRLYGEVKGMLKGRRLSEGGTDGACEGKEAGMKIASVGITIFFIGNSHIFDHITGGAMCIMYGATKLTDNRGYH